MIACAQSLQDYLRSPIGTAPHIETLPAQAISALGHFMPLYANAFFTQWNNIKNVVKVLTNEGALSPFYVHLTLKLGATAYTIDGGDMYFSLGAILTRSSAVTMTVFCHELAHMWLSQQPFYPALKQLNKEFLATFSSKKNAYLMSPIEVYAMVGSLCIMDVVCASLGKGRQKRRITKLIAFERQKLDTLQFEISMLKIPASIDSK